jgi:SOS-response transcriptional repressor LexA
MQWKFRLFDRDTLFALHYKISFPYILKTYISRNFSFLEQQRALIKSKFRSEFITFMNDVDKSKFEFFSFKFTSENELEEFVNKNFRKVIGKIIRLPNSKNDNILFAACHKEDRKFKDFLNEELLDENKYTCEIDTGYLNPRKIDLNITSIKILPLKQVQPFINSVPLYDIAVAAGQFSEPQLVSDCEWAELPPPLKASKDYFICMVIGDSMNKIIPNGSWCLFKKIQRDANDGEIVLVLHKNIQDADFGNSFTVKKIFTEKFQDGENSGNKSIKLKSYSNNLEVEINLTSDELVELKVIGVFVSVLK